MSRTLVAVEGMGGPDMAHSRSMPSGANEVFVRADDEWGQALVLFVEMELHCVAGALDEATDLAHASVPGRCSAPPPMKRPGRPR